MATYTITISDNDIASEYVDLICMLRNYEGKKENSEDPDNFPSKVEFAKRDIQDNYMRKQFKRGREIVRRDAVIEAGNADKADAEKITVS